MKSQVSLFKSDQCAVLASQQKSTNQWSLLNSTNATQGFKIELNSGEKCKTNPEINYQTSYIMKCNKDMKSNIANLTNAGTFSINTCTQSLEFESKDACPIIDFYLLWNFFNDNYVIFGIAMIVIGLFELLLGAKMITITIFLVTTLASIAVIFIFLFQFIIPSGGSSAMVWVVLGISTVVGLILSYLIAKNNKEVIGIILGCLMGYTFGMMLYSIVIRYVKANPTVSIK